jgi:hypothetical protein
MTRRELVLAVANQDGGAHVDPALGDAAYAAVSRDQSLGTITVTGPHGEPRTVDDSPALAAVRQIAYEVDETLRPVLGGGGPASP